MNSNRPLEILFDQVIRGIDSQAQLQYIRPKSGNATFTSQNGAPPALRIEMPRIRSADLKQSYACYALELIGGTNPQLAGSGSIIKTSRTIVNSEPVEDLQKVNMYRKMIGDMECDDARLNSNWQEGFGTDAELQARAATSNTLNNSYVYSPNNGIVQQPKIIPLYAVGGSFEFEFEFESSEIACIDSASATYYSVTDFKLALETHELSNEYVRGVLQSLQTTGFDMLFTSYKWSAYQLNATYNAPRLNLKKRSVKSVLFNIQASTNLSNYTEGWEFIPDNLTSFRIEVGGQSYPLHYVPFGAESKKELLKSQGAVDMIGPSSQLTRANYALDKAICGLGLENFMDQLLMTGQDWTVQDAILELNHSVAPSNSTLNVFIAYDIQLQFKAGSVGIIQ